MRYFQTALGLKDLANGPFECCRRNLIIPLAYSQLQFSGDRSNLIVNDKCSAQLQYSTNATVAHVGAPLVERSVIELQGKESRSFLQQLLTNDLRKLWQLNDGTSQHQQDIQNQTTKCLYASLLNPKGRFLHDLFIYSALDQEDTVFLDVCKRNKTRLQQIFSLYKLKQDVSIKDVSEHHQVWSVFPQTEHTAVVPKIQESQHMCYPDPRLQYLGFRAILPSVMTPQGILEDLGLQEIVGADEFTARRLKLGIAEGDFEIPTSSAIPLEYNIDLLNGISYEKGCYIGQELVARTHFQGQIRKRIMPFESQDGAVVEDEKLKNEKKQQVGQVRRVQGNVGIAMIRLEYIKPYLQGKSQILTDSGVDIKPYVPFWWPKDIV